VLIKKIEQQVKWSLESSSGVEAWAVQNFDTKVGLGFGSTTVTKSYANCDACSSQHKKYDSASEALKHLHSVHFDCSFTDKTEAKTQHRYHDDPCSAWLSTGGRGGGKKTTAMLVSEEFLSTLLEITGKLNELQWLVATSSRRRRRPGHIPAEDMAPSQNKHDPRLPRSLVYTFESIVEYYVLFAKQLSLANRVSSLKRHSQPNSYLNDRAERMVAHCHKANKQIQQHVQEAKKDIILSKQDSKMDDIDATLGTRNVDAVFLSSVLSGTLLARSFAHPLLSAKCKARRSKGVQGTGVSDIVGIYKEYNTRLRIEAARRPRRRVILGIHALLDELGALHHRISDVPRELNW